MEREPRREQINEGEFKAELLVRKQNYISLCTNGKLTPEQAAGLIIEIDQTLLTVNEALCEDLRVKFYKEADDIFYAIEPKEDFGFKRR